jgi:hypothetical protein
VELHILAQEKGVGLAILGDLPAVRQIGDDGFSAVAQGCPGKLGISESELVLNIGRGLRG